MNVSMLILASLMATEGRAEDTKLSPPKIETIWQREVFAGKCSTEDGLDRLPPEKALEHLEAIHWLDSEEIKTIRHALDTDFGESYLRWVVVAHSDCASQRLRYATAIFKGPKENGPRLFRTLKKTKAPTLLNVMIDVIVFQKGLENGFFASDSSLLGDLRRFREDLKKESIALEEDGKIFEDEHVGETAPTADVIARFKASKNLDRMHAAAMREWEISEKGFVRLHELLDRTK